MRRTTRGKLQPREDADQGCNQSPANCPHKKSARAGLAQGLTPDASPSGFAAFCPQKTHRFSPSNRFHSVDIFSDLLLIIFFL
jgi:hypothetical protein